MAQQQTYDFPSAIKGDTYGEVQFTVLVNGVAKSLVGASIKMTLTKELGCGATAEWTTGNGKLVITNAAAGIFTTAFGIVDLAVFVYNYEIEFTFADATVKSWVIGTFPVID